MTYSNLRKRHWNSIDKFIINSKIFENKDKEKYTKYMDYDLKQNDRVEHFFLLNSANVAL